MSQITSFTATWTALIILLTLHMSMNYIAVRSVQMTSLNRQRANIVFSALLDSDSELDLSTPAQRRGSNATPQANRTVLTPAEVSRRERIFERDGVLNWSPAPWQRQVVGFCRIGVDIPSFLPGSMTAGIRAIKPTTGIPKLATIFASESYMLSLFEDRGTWEGRILLKPDSSVESQLKAWAHALLAARVLSLSPGTAEESVLGVISRTLEFLNENGRFGGYIAGLRGKGWDLGIAALETRSGRRVNWH